MTETGVKLQRATCTRRVRRVVVLGLAVMWIGAGAAKLIGLDTFEQIVFAHGVFKFGVIRWVWVVPVFEVCLGVFVGVAGGSRGWPRLAKTASILSGLLLGIFCWYILQVPEDVFRTVGCGCEGPLAITDVVGAPSRGFAVSVNVVLICVGWFVWPLSVSKIATQAQK